MTYDTTLPVPKQSCWKKINIVPFALMINHKPVILLHAIPDLSSSLHMFSLFLSIKGSSKQLPQNKHRRVTETAVIKRSSDTYVSLIRNRV